MNLEQDPYEIESWQEFIRSGKKAEACKVLAKHIGDSLEPAKAELREYTVRRVGEIDREALDEAIRRKKANAKPRGNLRKLI